MSCDIRRYVSIDNDREFLDLTAFVGGEEYGRGIQFTVVGGDYVRLSEKQLLDLVFVIIARILGKKGFTATESADVKVVHPDGTITVLEGESIYMEDDA